MFGSASVKIQMGVKDKALCAQSYRSVLKVREDRQVQSNAVFSFHLDFHGVR